MFESLDYLYMPAPDIDASVKYYTSVLGGRAGVEDTHAYDVWVACVQVAKSEPPYLLLADHIKELMLIYRVANLNKASAALKSKGWK